jgi:hypothetical protein
VAGVSAHRWTASQGDGTLERWTATCLIQTRLSSSSAKPILPTTARRFSSTRRASTPDRRCASGAQLEGRPSDDAKPGDLQWSKISFSEREAPAELFTLSQRSQTYLIASRRIVDALAGKFREVHASAFHRTSGDGGTRPAMAAFEEKVRDRRR